MTNQVTNYYLSPFPDLQVIIRVNLVSTSAVDVLAVDSLWGTNAEKENRAWKNVSKCWCLSRNALCWSRLWTFLLFYLTIADTLPAARCLPLSVPLHHEGREGGRVQGCTVCAEPPQSCSLLLRSPGPGIWHNVRHGLSKETVSCFSA